MSKKVIIMGASGHGKVIADIILNAGDTVIGFLDDDPKDDYFFGFPILGSIKESMNFKEHSFFIAIGDNEIRKQIAQKYEQLVYYTAIHPNAIIARAVVIEKGSCLMAGVVVNSGTVIGKHVIINTGARIDHDAVIEDFVHISPGAVLAGAVKVGSLSHVGVGVMIKNNVELCENCVIGVGGVVVKALKSPGIYVGIPVRRLRL